MTTQYSFINVIIWLAAAYLVGSINISLIAGKLTRVGDIRTQGSKNAGATNLFRTVGFKIAALVLALDIGKAVALVLLCRAFGPKGLAPIAAVFLVIGNLFPLFHRLKGGKGAAAAVGGVLAFSPLTMLFGGAVFLLVFFTSKRVSAGSIFMAFSWVLFVWLLNGTFQEMLSAASLACLIVFSHKTNIVRLVKGKEPKLNIRSGWKK